MDSMKKTGMQSIELRFRDSYYQYLVIKEVQSVLNRSMSDLKIKLMDKSTFTNSTTSTSTKANDSNTDTSSGTVAATAATSASTAITDSRRGHLTQHYVSPDNGHLSNLTR
eukprot:5973-Heterococcus_DN1.PRE.2